jgi:threonine/homoserine/homoserine lactone efflux protein
MIDPKRLEDEIEIHDAIERRKHEERAETIWAVGLFLLLISAIAHYWIFVRPERLARLTPQQIRNRRGAWILCAVLILIALLIFGQD